VGGADWERFERISSTANPTFKLARSLRLKRVRQRERALLVEGPRAIRAAFDAGARALTLLVAADHAEDVPDDLIRTTLDAGGRVLLVDAQLFREIAATEHPQAVIAITGLPSVPLPARCTFVVALDAVRDPGNLGTLVRASAAAGADGIALLPGCVDPYNAKVIRASAGTIFAIPIEPVPDLRRVVEDWFEVRPVVAVADASAARAYTDVDWTHPTVLVVGGETTGIGDYARTYADLCVSIPMAPEVESLNAGVAGAILAFEVARQRRGNR
jgi:TrmH family RNA methyltransferase